MDVCSVSTAKAQSMSLTTVGTAMLNKSLETMDSMGQGLMKMMDAASMERSVNPHIGSNFDMLV
ncbi:MAG: YjfB family protein [Lachnospiraceae bacterium]|nr:YjfB family protein [Lachnospiraceae bacterium]MDD7026447.1 YjfB family protein [Lachnospiraceae bacterium]MDY5700814.1 YjfB family protein [Lachnospiraceae bacterium]